MCFSRVYHQSCTSINSFSNLSQRRNCACFEERTLLSQCDATWTSMVIPALQQLIQSWMVCVCRQALRVSHTFLRKESQTGHRSSHRCQFCHFGQLQVSIAITQQCNVILMPVRIRSLGQILWDQILWCNFKNDNRNRSVQPDHDGISTYTSAKLVFYIPSQTAW